MTAAIASSWTRHEWVESLRRRPPSEFLLAALTVVLSGLGIARVLDLPMCETFDESLSTQIAGIASAATAFYCMARENRRRQHLEASLRSEANGHEQVATELRKIERRFRDFAQIGANVTWEMDDERRFTYTSNAIMTLTGVPAHRFIGQSLDGLAAEIGGYRQLDGLLDRRAVVDNEPLTVLRRDGRQFHLLVSIKPIEDEFGRLRGYRGTTRDVTAQRSAELETERMRISFEAAAAADSAKTKFLSHMSHELRTPLNAIIGFAEMLSSELFGPLGNDRYRGYSQDIGASARYLLDIINDLLDLSRIEAGRYTLSLEGIETEEVIAEALTISGASSRKSIAVDVDIDPGCALIRADRRALKQVLVNLLSNSLKFTPDGGHVRVSARTVPMGGHAIEVSDNGCGIAAHQLEGIFQPFQQQEYGETRPGGGVGLGLLISRGLVKLHGGDLSIESKVGAGTVVRLSLPAPEPRLLQVA